MGKKLIPGGDRAFESLAKLFAKMIGGDPSKFEVSQDDADALVKAVDVFVDALAIASRGGSKSQVATRAKNEARAEAQAIVSRIGQAIRANKAIPSSAKLALNVEERPTRLKRQTCPMEPPKLRFSRVLHQRAGSVPMHELTFSSVSAVISRAKPDGAVRIELFVDLVPPDAPVPVHPGENHGGRPWYLRSYTRSPIVVAPPMARVPMRVVYWARWADSAGNVGPFSATAVGWVEGGNISLPAVTPDRRPALINVDTSTLQQTRDSMYTVALIETHYLSLNGPRMDVADASPKQIEDQSQSEAA
jgi:hypothetical protein